MLLTSNVSTVTENKEVCDPRIDTYQRPSLPKLSCQTSLVFLVSLTSLSLLTLIAIPSFPIISGTRPNCQPHIYSACPSYNSCYHHSCLTVSALSFPSEAAPTATCLISFPCSFLLLLCGQHIRRLLASSKSLAWGNIFNCSLISTQAEDSSDHYHRHSMIKSDR